jgi:ribosomal protein S27AE
MYGVSLFHGMYGYHAASEHARQAESAARRSESRAGEVLREMEILGERVDKLILINMAMWSLIKNRLAVSEEDLAKMAQEIDLRDGVPDGKITRRGKKCAKCGRTISIRHNKCLFCGSESLSETVFENI